MFKPYDRPVIIVVGILMFRSFFCIPKASKEHDSVTNRVAGFICKHVFTEHSSCVTGLAVVGREAGYKTTYLVRLELQ